jgi:hypothetical protein
LETLDVHGYLTREFTFNVLLLHSYAQTCSLFLREVIGMCSEIDTHLGENLYSKRTTDTLDSGEANHDLLVSGDGDTCDTEHDEKKRGSEKSTLALLVLGRLADDTAHALAQPITADYETTVFADGFYRGADFHD